MHKNPVPGACEYQAGVEDDVERYVRGELDERQAEMLEDHVFDCRRCADVWDLVWEIGETPVSVWEAAMLVARGPASRKRSRAR